MVTIIVEKKIQSWGYVLVNDQYSTIAVGEWKLIIISLVPSSISSISEGIWTLFRLSDAHVD